MKFKIVKSGMMKLTETEKCDVIDADVIVD
jgi:hypothetical protein